MTYKRTAEALDLLDKFSFFNQRAGRELWFYKAKEVQEQDIEIFDRDVDILKNLIQRQQERIEALEFLDAHRMYEILGRLEEYEKFYVSSDIKIGLRIAIDILKKGIFGTEAEQKLAEMGCGCDE